MKKVKKDRKKIKGQGKGNDPVQTASVPVEPPPPPPPPPDDGEN